MAAGLGMDQQLGPPGAVYTGTTGRKSLWVVRSMHKHSLGYTICRIEYPRGLCLLGRCPCHVPPFRFACSPTQKTGFRLGIA